MTDQPLTPHAAAATLLTAAAGLPRDERDLVLEQLLKDVPVAVLTAGLAVITIAAIADAADVRGETFLEALQRIAAETAPDVD